MLCLSFGGLFPTQSNLITDFFKNDILEKMKRENSKDNFFNRIGYARKDLRPQ